MGETSKREPYFTQKLVEEWSMCSIKIDGRNFQSLLDTGADVSIISSHQCPTSWTDKEAAASLRGLGPL